jgi:Zn-dependent protease/predicted transcriptional regulator
MAFVTYTAFTDNLKLWQSIAFISIIIVLFVCVVLHEYGHALAARRLGVRTQDIILSPVGGVARLAGMPEKPWSEFVIALAGPMVNLVIVILLGTGLYLSGNSIFPESADYKLAAPIDILKYIVLMNLSLFLFNLVPAFPMDGGRILRALMATRMGHFKATKVAAFIGRVLAVVFIILGVTSQQLVLAMIGLVIFMMAGQEYNQSKVSYIMKNAVATKIMRTSYSRLHENDTYATAIQKYNEGQEKNFLIYDSLGHIIGVLPEILIQDAIKNNNFQTTIGPHRSNKVADVPISLPIKEIHELMKQRSIALVTVVDHDQVVGVIDRYDIEAFMEKAMG